MQNLAVNLDLSAHPSQTRILDLPRSSQRNDQHEKPVEINPEEYACVSQKSDYSWLHDADATILSYFQSILCATDLNLEHENYKTSW